MLLCSCSYFLICKQLQFFIVGRDSRMLIAYITWSVHGIWIIYVLFICDGFRVVFLFGQPRYSSMYVRLSAGYLKDTVGVLTKVIHFLFRDWMDLREWNSCTAIIWVRKYVQYLHIIWGFALFFAVISASSNSC